MTGPRRDSDVRHALDSRRAIEVVRRTLTLATERELTLLAAGVAFYAFLSLVPLALISLALATFVGGETLAAFVTEALEDVLTPSARELLEGALLEGPGRGGATVLGGLGLLWASSRVLRGLDRAFSEIYATGSRKSIVGQLRDGAIVFVAITVGLLAMGGIEALIAATTTGLLSAFGPLFLFLTLLVAFLPLYVVFPDAGVGLGEALPGAALAAVGWTLLSRTFGLYATFAGTYTLYGALGGVFLVLTWLYVGSVVVMGGVALNAVLAGRDRQLQSAGVRGGDQQAMTDETEAPSDRGRARTSDRADDPAALREEIERLREELAAVEEDVERRTVRRESLEADLKRYVRRRIRRGHARGWGPYLVLAYGTVMTVAAFYFLAGVWAVLAMFVVWTSVLGVFFLMVLFGLGLSVLDVPGRLRDRIGEWRS